MTTRNSFKPVFSFYLTKNGKAGSAVTLGGYDLNKFAAGEATWVNTDAENRNFWSLPMESNEVRLGQSKAKIASTNVIIDSGLSYSLIPARDVLTIAS